MEEKMKIFKYMIKDEIGIHARPAGMLAKEAKKFNSKIIITKDGRSAEATKMIELMGMGVKKGNLIEVMIEGADEDAALDAIQTFFEKNL